MYIIFGILSILLSNSETQTFTMANFNYRDILFDDDFQLGHDDKLLSLTRNLDLVTLAIRNESTRAIQVRIYRFDPDFCFKLKLQWSGDMTAYIKTPRKNPVLRAEYQKIEVHTLMCEYASEYVVTCIHRKQTPSIMKQIPDSYIIGNFHLVSVLDNSITVIKRVMPQNTKICQHAVYSFIPYGTEFYSVIGILDLSDAKDESDDEDAKCLYTQRENELYLTRGSIKFPETLDHANIKRCSVKYNPVCNLNTLCNQSPDIKYCMYNSIEHVLYDGCNIITIKLEHNKYKITHKITELTVNNNITLNTFNMKSRFGDNYILSSHGSNGFIKFNYAKPNGKEHYEISMELVTNGVSQPLQIINSWPNTYDLKTNFLNNPYDSTTFVSENLLLVKSYLNSKRNATVYMLYSIDYNTLTATMVTCVNVKQYNAVFFDNIFGGIDNTMIILNNAAWGTQPKKKNTPSVAKAVFKILYPSSQSLPHGLDMLSEHLPHDMIELVNNYITSSPVTAHINF